MINQIYSQNAYQQIYFINFILLPMSHARSIVKQCQVENRISHPSLYCPSGHEFINICVDNTCKANALYCGDDECYCYKPHEECEHIAYSSMTKSLQKCSEFQLQLQNQIKKIYEQFTKKLKKLIQQEVSMLPIGDLDQQEELILNTLYIERQQIQFTSKLAKRLNQKIRKCKIRMQSKLPEIINRFNDQIMSISNQIVDLQTKSFQELACEQDLSLTEHRRRSLKSEKMQVHSEQKINIQTTTFTNSNKYIQDSEQQDMNQCFSKFGGKISQLQQKIKQDQINPQKLAIHTSTKRKEMKEEEFLWVQPDRDEQNEEMSNYFNLLDRLLHRNILNDQLASVYEKLGDELRESEQFKDSIYYYNQARFVLRKMRKQSTKSYAYQTFWMASNFNQIQHYDKSLQLFMEALRLYERVRGNNKQQEIASTLSNIGLVYFNLDNFKESIVYNQKAIQSLLKMKNENLLDIAIYKKNIGDAYLQMQNFEQAQRQFLQCLSRLQDDEPETNKVKGQCFDKLIQLHQKAENYQISLRYMMDYLINAQKSQDRFFKLQGKFLDYIGEYADNNLDHQTRGMMVKILDYYQHQIQKMVAQLNNLDQN